MYHSVTFNEKNTWNDWHLIPSTRPVINPPVRKTKIVDLPGTDGFLDLSEVVAGHPTYENRTGTIEFIAENGFKPWNELYSEILNYLHGKKIKLILEDDPSYFYEGVVTVSAWDSGDHYSTISIDYDLAPYKKSLDETESIL